MLKNKIKLVAKSILPTEFGKFVIRVYKDDVGLEHVALLSKKINKNKPVLMRVHSECITGEVFHSQKCDCKQQFDLAMEKISKEGGVVVYLRQEGRGIGLGNKIKAYHLQEKGYDTVDANIKLGFAPDLRDYKIAVQILNDLGIVKVKLLTNNPLKVSALKKLGLDVVEREAVETLPNKNNISYLRVKKKKMGHLLRKV